MANLAKRPDVVQRLAAEGFLFNFFQALSLLEEKFQKEGSKDPFGAGKIRCVPDTSLAFPASDISHVREKKGYIELVLSFMGLIGVSSPLPVYFSEYVLRYEENAPPLIDFLNIFNNRMYVLFFRSWKKYRFVRALSGGIVDPFVRRTAFLSGIDPDRLSIKANFKLLAYAGLFTAKCRGKAALITMLSDFFGGLPVDIKEYMPRWVAIHAPPKIGVDSRLGVTSMLGTTKWDVSGKFRVSVGPLPRETFEAFLPHTDNIEKIKDLVRRFLSDPLDFDIEVRLQSCELVPVILGKDNTRLGETSSLGISGNKSDVQSIVIE
ncbi:MAG: type VI secretion system baseplate subunit TssG [Chitinivibrionales bacterium]